jgi:hypothetical protein
VWNSFSQATILLHNEFNGYLGILPTVAPGWYYSWHDTSVATRSYYATAATCGLAIPAYKFGKDSVTIITPAFAYADSLIFYLKGNGIAHDTNTFFVFASPDSINWTPIYSRDSISLTSTVIGVGLSAAYTHIKFFYRKCLPGFNVGIDDIIILNHLVNIPMMHLPVQAIYPNPSNRYLTIQLGNNPIHHFTLFIRNGSGELLREVSIEVPNNDYSLDLSGYEEGMYLIGIKTEDRETWQRIMVQK